MKRNFLLAIALVLALGSFAQVTDGPKHSRGGKPGMQPPPGRDMQGKMAKDLNLTEAQHKQIKDLQKDFDEKMKSIQQNESITVKQQRDEIYNLEKKRRADMKKILTPEQQEKMTALRVEQDKKMQEGQARRFEKWAGELKLSDAQKTECAALQARQRNSMQALRDNDNLDRTTKDKQVKALMEQHNKDISKILNKEQQKQWEEMRKQRPMPQRGPKGMGPKHPGFI